MFKKATQVLSSDFEKLNGKAVFWILFFIALFVRFPFFFRDYIDRDESTFILMGQAWVDGFLPYTQLWDLKPPITFLFFAVIIKIFGKSFTAIRLAGTFLVALSAFFTYKMGARTISKKAGVLSAVICTLLFSMFGSLQGVMSEHISITFFVIAVYTLLFKKQWYWYLISGVLFGLAIMSKLNMAYALLFLMLYQLYFGIREKKISSQIQKLFMLGVGTLFIIIITALPYYLQDSIEIWWKSVIQAPLAYGSEENTSSLKPFLAFVTICGLIALGYTRKVYRFDDSEITSLIFIIVGIFISFVQAGKINGHYLIQLYPFLLILTMAALSKMKVFKHTKYLRYMVFLIPLLPMEAYLEYVNIVKNKIEKGSFFNGEGIDVPNYFLTKDLNIENIFFAEYHIGYWLLDRQPLTKASTHPSNILRGELFPYMENPRTTSNGELKYIMERVRPEFIVTRKNRRVFDKKKYAPNLYMNLQLSKHYFPLDTIDNAVIHQRLKIHQ